MRRWGWSEFSPDLASIAFCHSCFFVLLAILLHLVINGPVHKPVQAFALLPGVLLEFGLAALWDLKFDAVIGLFVVAAVCVNARFCSWGHISTSF